MEDVNLHLQNIQMSLLQQAMKLIILYLKKDFSKYIWTAMATKKNVAEIEQQVEKAENDVEKLKTYRGEGKPSANRFQSSSSRTL